MTTICLQAKNSIKTEAWSSAFNSFNTDAKSCLFIKQLTSTCVSTILFLRKVLPDECFETRNFEGTPLKLLKSKPGDNYVIKIQQWLEGAFEAIEKKYLKRLMLDIQDAESNKILEIYTMSFTYWNEKDNPSNFINSSFTDRFSVTSTKSSTTKLLKMCYAVTQTYRSLPSKVSLDIRLSYYDNTPIEYQPRGYIDWEHVNLDFSNEARSIEIGTTNTPHHFFKLFNKSSLNDRFFKSLEDELKTSASNEVTEVDFRQSKNISHSRETKAKRELCFNITKNNTTSNIPIPSKPETAAQLFVVSEKDTSLCRQTKPKLGKDLKNQAMRCSCMFSKKSESMFSCSNCGFLVHAECFGILNFDSSKKIRFYCHICHQKENIYRCHDKILLTLKSSSDQQKLSLLRRVLKHCTTPTVNKITLKKMEKIVGLDCQNTIMNIILKKMIEMGVAIPQGKRKNYLIDRKKLTDKLNIYFYKVQNSEQSSQQILPYPLRNFSKRKKENSKIINNKSSQNFEEVLKKEPSSQTGSQLSYDIFS